MSHLPKITCWRKSIYSNKILDQTLGLFGEGPMDWFRVLRGEWCWVLLYNIDFDHKRAEANYAINLE